MSLVAISCLLLTTLLIGVHTLEPCERDDDCVINGLCLPSVPDKGDNSTLALRSCFCPKSCISSVPVECTKSKQCVVQSLPSTHHNRCDKAKRLCLCMAPEDHRHVCSKGNLKIVMLNATRSRVYLGEPFGVTCCVNMEPKSVELRWYHNGTELLSHVQPDSFELCWKLNVASAKFRDAGDYVCSATTSVHSTPVTASVSVAVRSSRFYASVKNSLDGDQASPAAIGNEAAHLTLEAIRINGTSMLLNWFSSAPSSVVKVKIEKLDGAGASPVPETMVIASNASGPKVIGGLEPSLRYSVSAETVSDDATLYGKTVVNEHVTPVTTEPLGLTMRIEDEIARTRCRVSWRTPLISSLPILHYTLDVYGTIRHLGAAQSTRRAALAKHRPKSSNCRNVAKVPADGSLTYCEFEGLLPNHNYSAKVWAVSAAGKGAPAFVDSQCLTSYGSPAFIETPLARRGADEQTIDVHFPSSPNATYGPITCYFLAIVPCTLNVNFSQLPPPGYINFEVYKRALQSNLHVMFQPIYAYIAEAYYELPKRTLVGDGQQLVDTSSNSSRVIDFLGRFVPEDGRLERGYKYIGFLIARVDPDKSVYNLSSVRPETLPIWMQPMYSFSGYFVPVFLGDPGEQMTISEHEKKRYMETMYIVAVGFSVLVVLIIFVTFGCFYYSNIKGWLKTILCVDENLMADRASFTELQRVNKCRDFQPTRLEDLPAEYLLRHRDSNFLFTVEFESLPHYSFDTLASDLPENAGKNRYNDIKAFDITRVRLNKLHDDKRPPRSSAAQSPGAEEQRETIELEEEEEEDDELSSDYINANYIQGYKGKKLFIAAQGPTMDTVNDFWRVIWEQNVHYVIMVTNLQEKYRTMCIKYWPEHGSAYYGELEVKLTESVFFSNYVIRTFSVRCRRESAEDDDQAREENPLLENCHQVVQYHYTGWYDYRAPEGNFGFLRFMKEFKRLQVARDLPILVHCSAGVGRTGTFIAVDGLMDQMAEEGRVDVFGYVSNLRRQRNFMVQSLDQYVFIYKVLAEWYMFGDTDVEAERIDEYVRNLRQRPCHDSQLTAMDQEFNKLMLTLDDQPNCDFAHKDFNEKKNRYQTVVPYDRNRVVLAPLFGHDDASYINASVIRGYLCQYVMTQDPLYNTIWDFWRMIVEQKVSCIVCLTDERALECGERYWPAELNHGVSFGDKPLLTVQKVHEERLPSCTLRTLHVTSSKENELRKVVQYSYGDWSADSVGAGQPSIPNSTVSLFDLIGKVSQRQLHSPNAGPVVVHCRDGSERSGLYCATSLLLERLRREGKVDVFKTVKMLQFQRTHVIASMAQYDFCYQSILDYLQSFG